LRINISAHPFESTKPIKLNHGYDTPQLPLTSFSLLARYYAPLRSETAGVSYTGIAATIRCKYRVQNGRASTERFSLSGRPNPQETTTAASRRNPLAASQPSGQPPLVAAVTTPECIPTALAIIERGDTCIATRPTNWWGCLLVELLRSAKNISPSLSLSLSLSLSRSIYSSSFGRTENCRVENGGCTRPMY